ncbi:lipopolysaccharide biosynthesis protein [Micromonospora sp. CPCC 206061]|uniref:lipopolysaccharide biosynthesis protein n=1 Tax=Micromonospora sp. CPCC 206061 TaxID=3122410 RepID=UPI002FF0ECED
MADPSSTAISTSTATAGRRIVHNSFSMLVARAVMAGAGLVSLPVVYQRLGSREFGVWVLLCSLMGVLSLVDLGLGSALVREVAEAVGGAQHTRLPALLALGLAWAVFVGLLALVGSVVCWPSLVGLLHLGEMAGETWQATLWLALGLLFSGIEMPWRSILEGTQRYTEIAWITGIAAVLGAGLAILIMRLGGGLAALAGTAAATSAIRTVSMAVTARRCHPLLAPSIRAIRRSDLRFVRGYGLRVQVSSAASAVNTELDRLVLGSFFGPVTTGSFDVGSRLLNLLRLPPGVVLIALFPVAVAGATRNGPDWLDRFYLITTKYVAFFVASGAAALVVCADPLVRLWLGHEVALAAASIAILAPSYALNLAAGAATIVTRAEGRPGRETRYVLMSVVLNVALTIPLLQLLGPVGVPLSTALAVMLSTGYFLAHFHRVTRRPIEPLLRAMVPPIAAAVIAGAIGCLMAPHLPDGPGRMAAGLAVLCRSWLTLLVAAALLVAIGFVDARDWRRLLALLRNRKQYVATTTQTKSGVR